jgi:hypothetical protein
MNVYYWIFKKPIKIQMKKQQLVLIVLSILFLSISASSYSGPLPDNGISMTLEKESSKPKEVNADSCYVDCSFFENIQTKNKFGVSFINNQIVKSTKNLYPCWSQKFQEAAFLKYPKKASKISWNLNLVTFLYTTCKLME